MGNIKAMTKIVNFDTNWELDWFPAFRTHSFSFNADRKQVDEKVQPNYSLRKAVIAALHFHWPGVHTVKKYCFLNFKVSVVEYSGPTKEGNFISRFQKRVFNCQSGNMDEVSVEPPVELVPGRTYSVIVEDHSPADSIHLLHKESKIAYLGSSIRNSNTHGNVDLEDGSVIFKDIHWNTDYYEPELCNGSHELTMIKNITIRQM